MKAKLVIGSRTNFGVPKLTVQINEETRKKNLNQIVKLVNDELIDWKVNRMSFIWYFSLIVCRSWNRISIVYELNSKYSRCSISIGLHFLLTQISRCTRPNFCWWSKFDLLSSRNTCSLPGSFRAVMRSDTKNCLWNASVSSSSFRYMVT